MPKRTNKAEDSDDSNEERPAKKQKTAKRIAAIPTLNKPWKGLVKKKKKCVALPKNFKWLQTRTRNLFVPDSYVELWRKCRALLNSGKSMIFLKGTPGIGKSCFLDYVLFIYLTNEMTVTYINGSEGKAIHFKPNGETESSSVESKASITKFCAKHDADIILYDPPEQTLLTDNVPWGAVEGTNCIVAVSPNRDNCKKLIKRSARVRRTLYAGPLNLGEAQEMRKKCYAEKFTEEEVARRYSIVGGVSRHLFTDDWGSVENTQLGALTDSAKNPNLIDSGNVATESSNLWTVYHVVPYDNFTKYTIEVCCDSAETRLRDALMKQSVAALWESFEQTGENLGSLRGIRYEAYAHKKILDQGLQGNAFKFTKSGLSTGKKSSLSLKMPAKVPEISLKDNRLKNNFGAVITGAKDTHKYSKGAYLLPRLPNFPVVDSLWVSAQKTLLLQMKAGRSDPLSASKATTIIGVTGVKDLIFVVPDEVSMTKALAFRHDKAPALNQYRFILREA